MSSHMRSSPNSVKFDNWSTKGNVNPYTGKVGSNSIFSPSLYTLPSIPSVTSSNGINSALSSPTSYSLSSPNEKYATWSPVVIVYTKSSQGMTVRTYIKTPMISVKKDENPSLVFITSRPEGVQVTATIESFLRLRCQDGPYFDKPDGGGFCQIPIENKQEYFVLPVTSGWPTGRYTLKVKLEKYSKMAEYSIDVT